MRKVKAGWAIRLMCVNKGEDMKKPNLGDSINQYRGLLFTLIAFCIACGDQDDAAPQGGSEDISEDYTVFDVDWRDDALILDEIAPVLEALVEMNYESGELVLSSSYEHLSELEVGTAALIGGIGVFRILDRETTPDGERLYLEDAPLTEIIENGTIEWRRSFVTTDDADKVGLGIDEDEATSIGRLQQALTGSYKDGVLKASDNIAGFDTKLRIAHEESGLKMSLSAKAEAGESSAYMGFSGTLRGLTNETKITIENRSITNFKILVEDVEGEVSIEGQGVSTGTIENSIRIPARLSLPIVLGGIPFHLDISGSLEVRSTLGATSSTTIKASSSFKGSAGVRVKGSEVTRLGKFDSPGLQIESSKHKSNITAGYGTIIDFPKVSIGVGAAKLASADVYIAFKVEAISNIDITYEGTALLPYAAGSCLRASVNFGAFYGGNASFLGFSVWDQERPIYVNEGKDYTTGDMCEESTP